MCIRDRLIYLIKIMGLTDEEAQALSSCKASVKALIRKRAISKAKITNNLKKLTAFGNENKLTEPLFRAVNTDIEKEVYSIKSLDDEIVILLSDNNVAVSYTHLTLPTSDLV